MSKIENIDEKTDLEILEEIIEENKGMLQRLAEVEG